MSKRRNENEEEEDTTFKVPKFDEESFLKRERRNIKTSFLAFIFACLMALVCFGFWALMGSGTDLRWILVLLVCIVYAASIKFIFLRLNIDLTDFAKKNWFMIYGIYFFTWLLVFIVLVNPPFYDDEGPLVDMSVLPGMQELGGNITIVAKVTDNANINTNDITLDLADPEGNTSILIPDGFDYYDTVVRYSFENPKKLLGEFSFSLTVKDVNGHETKKTGVFSYDENTIKITSPPTNFFKNITSGVDIKIEVDESTSPENFRVYYTLNDGGEINVDRKNVNEKDTYETSPEYDGWLPSNEYTMKVYAEVSHYFINVPITYSNIVEDTTVYNFTTAYDAGIGDEAPPAPFNWTKWYTSGGKPQDNTLNYDTIIDQNRDLKPDSGSIMLPYSYGVGVPGFELIILIAAIVVVILIFKKKNKDEKKHK